MILNENIINYKITHLLEYYNVILDYFFICGTLKKFKKWISNLSLKQNFQFWFMNCKKRNIVLIGS
jgi:hypothetical protein